MADQPPEREAPADDDATAAPGPAEIVFFVDVETLLRSSDQTPQKP